MTLQNYTCPRWHELPDVPLYLDQVVMVVQNAIGVFSPEGEVAVTKTMVNNYVKQGLLARPEAKKYQRDQLACLIVISLLKRVYSMQEIQALLAIALEQYATDQAYNMFCTTLEEILHGTYSPAGCTLTLKAGGEGKATLMRTTVTTLISKLVVQHYLA